MNKLKYVVIMLVLVGILVGPATFAQASSPGQVIMFIMDNINYDDMAQYGGENLRYLLNHGALGLMNTNSGGSYEEAHSYATIGAGSYAVCSPLGIYAKGYEQLDPGTDKVAPGNIVNRDLPALVKANEELNRPVKVGLLGSLLNSKGLKTAVIGNENTSLEASEVRAGLITMNQQGITDYGQVDSSLLRKDPGHPCGFSTDYDALFTAYNKLKDKADFMVIQSGDTHRLNKCTNVTKEEQDQAKATIFKNMDLFIGQVVDSLDQDSLLLVVVPFPSKEDAVAGKKLTPVMAYSRSISKGILTSATTKRDGIITNTDLAAEIACFFGLEKDFSMIGHDLIYKSHRQPLQFLNDINQITVFNYRFRPKIISAFISYIIVVLLLCVICVNHRPNYLSYLRPFLMSIMLVPTVFLLLPLFGVFDLLGFVFVTVLLTAVLSFSMSYLSRGNLSAFTVPLLFSVALIVGDIVLGNALMQVSILGYDPIVGARFYGIGNEYMGFLLGSTIISSTALVEKYGQHRRRLKWASAVVFLVVLLILALPNLGTNVGGTIAAFIGFSIALVLMFRQKITKKDLLLLSLCLVVSLSALFIYDGMRSAESQSHIGQASSMVQEGGISVLLQLFKRKLLMNYRLVKYSGWTRVLIAMIMVLVILFRLPVEIIKQIFRQHRYLYFGFIAGLAGTVAALIFNDSGVVAAATCIIPIGIPLILLCLDEISYTSSPNSYTSSYAS